MVCYVSVTNTLNRHTSSTEIMKTHTQLGGNWGVNYDARRFWKVMVILGFKLANYNCNRCNLYANCCFDAIIFFEMLLHMRADSPMHSVNPIGLISWFVVFSSSPHIVICRVLLEPTVKWLKHAYYRMYFETIRQNAPLTLPAMFSGKFTITLYRRILSFWQFSDRVFVVFWKWRQHPVGGIGHPKSSKCCSIRITVWKILTCQK